MKRKEKESLKAKPLDELTKLVRELETKLVTSSVSRLTEPPKNSRENRSLAQKLAIIKTYMHQIATGEKI